VSNDKPQIILSLEDEDALLSRGKPKLPAGAYDPYNVDPRPGKPAAVQTAANRTDLRKLSEWIKLKREIEELKAEEAKPIAAKK
jgi:hypothetical protein